MNAAPRLMAILVCMAAVAAPGRLSAQAPLPPGVAADVGPAPSADSNRVFQTQIRELDAAQRTLAGIAERRASPAVQAFAKQVRLGFSGGPSSLRGVSDDQGVPIVGTAPLARDHQALVTQLQAGDADVDHLFVDFEGVILRQALGLVDAYAKDGADARWREAAAQAASADRALLATAQSLQAR